METALSELFRIVLTVAFIGGFAWALWVMYRYYYRVDEYPVRLSRMMRRLGIDPSTTEESLFAHYAPVAALFCRYCESKAECDAWIARRHPSAAPPAFCANAGFLRSLATNRKAAAPPPFCPNADVRHLVAAIPQTRAE